MPARPITHRALRALAVTAAFGAVAFTAQPVAGHTAPQGGIVVQVRDFPGAATIDIVAWSATQPAFGLRSWVRRSGAPDRYHRFWVNSDYPGGRDVTTVKGLNRPLRLSTETDNQNCQDGKCSPTSTFGARLPDEPFRAAKEDVVLQFVTNSGSELNFTLRRALIDRYLAAVDSVVTSLKK